MRELLDSIMYVYYKIFICVGHQQLFSKKYHHLFYFKDYNQIVIICDIYRIFLYFMFILNINDMRTNSKSVHFI